MPIIHGNCIEVMRGMESRSIDLVVTDPAYWTLNKWREVGTTTRLGGHRDEKQRTGWFETINQEQLKEFVKLCHKVLAKDRHCWIMGDGETSMWVQYYGREIFDYVKPFPVIKMTNDGTGIKQGMGYHGRCSHEYFVLLEKGRRRFNDENFPDVFQFPWTGSKESDKFPTAKPVKLFERIIELSSKEKETILDPFLGSGTAAVAAENLNRQWIGIEINADNVEKTQKRLDTLKK